MASKRQIASFADAATNISPRKSRYRGIELESFAPVFLCLSGTYSFLISSQANLFLPDLFEFTSSCYNRVIIRV
jgi:hypothetical protein